MRIFNCFEEAINIPNPVVTTGSFDGVHVGHKAIIDRLNRLKNEHNGESVLITFSNHPRKVLYPETSGKELKMICSRKEKMELLRKAGLDNVITIEFTSEFSKTTSHQFVRDYLHGLLHARVIVVGFNHHFGFNKEGDYKQLFSWQERYNFKAEEIPVQEVLNESVSSTKIRQAIKEGNIQRANAYLDHYYVITGMSEKNTDNSDSYLSQLIRVETGGEFKLFPPPGIYAVSVEKDSGLSKGMAVIEEKDGEQPDVLIDILNCNGYYPNREVSVSFHKRIRQTPYMAGSASSLFLREAKDEIAELIY